MDDKELGLDVGQANEIKLAARRAGATNADLKRLSEGDMFAQILPVIRGEAMVQPAPLLKLVTTVSVDAVSRFVAADAFGAQNPDGLKFFLSDNFKRHFLGKVEEGVVGATLAVHAVGRDSLDAPIMTELGEKKAFLLAYLYQLVRAQAQGQCGPLLTNGYANIAYVVGGDGVVWAVRANWSSDFREWFVCAGSVADPNRWNAGDRVLSQV